MMIAVTGTTIDPLIPVDRVQEVSEARWVPTDQDLDPIHTVEGGGHDLAPQVPDPLERGVGARIAPEEGVHLERGAVLASHDVGSWGEHLGVGDVLPQLLDRGADP